MVWLCAEVSRKFMFIQGMNAVQVTSEDIHAHQFVQHMLIPPTDPRIQNPILCESPGEKCLPGEEVRCLIGLHFGCHCDHIRLCFPHASHCTVYNSTHSLSCGFWICSIIHYWFHLLPVKGLVVQSGYFRLCDDVGMPCSRGILLSFIDKSSCVQVQHKFFRCRWLVGHSTGH